MINKIKSLNYSLIDQAIVSGSNFLCSLIIVKLIGLNDFGVFSTCWIILLFISTICVSSIISPMMAIIPHRKITEEYFGSILLFQLVFSLGALIVSFFLCLLYFKISEFAISIKTILFFSFCVLFHHFQEFFRKYFFAIKNFKNAVIIDSITYLLRLSLLLCFLAYNVYLKLNIVFLIYLITSFFGSVYGIYKYRFNIDISSLKEDYVAHLNISRWLIPSGLLKWASVNLFLVSASILLGPVSLGIIKLSQNIVAVYNLVLLGLENFIPLEAGKVYANLGLDGLIHYVKKITVNGLIFTFIFAILLVIFSNVIIEFVYGKDFIRYSSILYWFSSFLVFMYLISIINIFLITINKTKITFKGYIYTSIFSLTIFYPLIQFFETTGVLLGMFCSYSFLLLMLLRLIKKNIHLWN